MGGHGHAQIGRLQHGGLPGCDVFQAVVDTMIAQPKLIEATFKTLPQGARDQIAKRDKPKA